MCVCGLGGGEGGGVNLQMNRTGLYLMIIERQFCQFFITTFVSLPHRGDFHGHPKHRLFMEK